MIRKVISTANLTEVYTIRNIFRSSDILYNLSSIYKIGKKILKSTLFIIIIIILIAFLFYKVLIQKICITTNFNMQQKINPENENEQQSKYQSFKKFKITKRKGTPFWLNLSVQRKNTYSKFKQNDKLPSINPYFQSRDFSPTGKQLDTDIKSNKEEESQFLEEVLSDNQFYQQDFQSYHTSKKVTQNFKQKLLNDKKVYSKTKKINFSMNKLKINDCGTPSPKIKINSIFSSKSLRNPSQLHSSICRSPKVSQKNMDFYPICLKKKLRQQQRQNIKARIKTQAQSRCQYKQPDLDKQYLMHQNTVYLKVQNLKLVRQIQQLRKMIPIALNNEQQLFYQRHEISNIKKNIYKSVSYKYQFSIDSNIQVTQSSRRKISIDIRKLNSPKITEKQKNFINDKFIVPIKPLEKLREQLLCKKKIYLLREQKLSNLESKIKIYQKFLDNLMPFQLMKNYNDFQRRKVFLEWDIERTKNQFDLRAIEESIKINDLKEQISEVNSQLQAISSKNFQKVKGNNEPYYIFKKPIIKQEFELQEQIQDRNPENQKIELIKRRKKIK